MTESTDYEYAQILLELVIPRYGFPFTWGCKKKRSAIAVAVATPLESPLPSPPKATKTTSSTTSLSFSPGTDHSDLEYNPIRKRAGAKKISLKREIKNANNYFDLDKESKLKIKETKQELSVGGSQDEIVSPMVNKEDVLPQISDGEGVDGPTGIPDLNIPYEPVGSDSIEGLDVNVAMTNEESK